jgi:sugar/nucleoside kinase (ribokinase family)
VIDFIAFGIIVDDLVFPQGATRMGVLGGGGPQAAWGMAAALGSGERVGLAAGVGTDLEESVLAPLQAAGINLEGVRTTDLPTPRAWQVLESDGRRTQVWRVPLQTLGTQLARTWDVLPLAYHSARAFHWGIHPGDALPDMVFGQQLRAQGRRVSLEPFRSPGQPLDESEIRAVLAACDVFSPNLLEAERITGSHAYPDMLGRFQALGGHILAVRRGADGADVWDLPAGNGVRVPAVQTHVVDVVGAGNAFCGALIARLDEGIAEATCHASVAASYLVEQVGIPPALPVPADYTRRLNETRAARQELAQDSL